MSPDTEVLIYTAAVKEDNPELVAAKSMNIPLLTRAEFLGQIMLNYPMAVGVAGTHGKTTTTSMLSQIMLQANTDPTILVGGIMPAIKGNTRVGHSDKLITEACEYTNSFLSFKPNLAIILNVAADHLDFFKDLDDIRHSFRKYAELVPADGALVINSDIDNLEYFTEGLPCTVITVGSDPSKSMYSATNIEYDEFARASYDLVVNNKVKTHIKLHVTGETTIRLIIPCDRCLEDVENTFHITIDRSVNPNTESDGIEDVDELSFIDGYMLDVDKLIMDEIVVALPTKVLCKEDCKGSVSYTHLTLPTILRV